jgi:hypothetical protein
VVIAQPVEDQHDQFAGGGDHADVAAAAFGDPVADLPEPGRGPEAELVKCLCKSI